MKPEEIKNAIMQVNNEIAMMEDRIAIAKRNIKQLKKLQENCALCEIEIEDSKTDKKIKLEALVEIENQSNFIYAYYNALEDLLEGDCYIRAISGIEDAKADIQYEISNQYSIIEDYQYELAGLKKRLGALEEKFSSLDM